MPPSTEPPAARWTRVAFDERRPRFFRASSLRTPGLSRVADDHVHTSLGSDRGWPRRRLGAARLFGERKARVHHLRGCGGSDAGPLRPVAGTELGSVGATIHPHRARRPAGGSSRRADGRWRGGAVPRTRRRGTAEAGAEQIAVGARAGDEPDARGSVGQRRGRARASPLARAATDAGLVGAGIPARVVSDGAVALLCRQVRGRIDLARRRHARPRRFRALARVVAISTLEVRVATGGSLRRSVCRADTAGPRVRVVRVVAAKVVAEAGRRRTGDGAVRATEEHPTIAGGREGAGLGALRRAGDAAPRAADAEAAAGRIGAGLAIDHASAGGLRRRTGEQNAAHRPGARRSAGRSATGGSTLKWHPSPTRLNKRQLSGNPE